jgi:hypothetical protein
VAVSVFAVQIGGESHEAGCLTSLPLRRPNLLPGLGTLELDHLVARVRAWYALSVDEALVALGVWARCTDAEIAAWLGWDEERVEECLRRCCRVLRPLDLGSRAGVGEAVVRAMQGGGRAESSG